MRRGRGAVTLAVLCALAACHLPAAAPVPGTDIAASFDAQIAKLDAQDPQAPQALETHLRYADYLAQTPGENCGDRLNAAQAQLQAARRYVALGAVLPQGLARAADIEYQIHTALAACGDPADLRLHREPELRAALEAAQLAAALYEDTFDYSAMLTMQFNAAVTQRSLGDAAAAQVALESVIERDREFGFRDDAEENYRLLLSWTHADARPDPAAGADRSASAAEVTALMQDFQQRVATLRFAWTPGDTLLSLETDSVRVIGNAVAHATGGRTLTRSVRKRPFGWTVTYRSRSSHYSLDPVSADSGMEESFMTALAGMLLQFHDFSLKDMRSATLGASADFDGLTDPPGLPSAQVRREGDSLLADLKQNGGPRAAVLMPMLNSALHQLMEPGAVEARTALEYNLETGAWPGAVLEQGHWYDMELALPLPFAPLNYVLHQVRFAFTRDLPCSQQSRNDCIELVLRAVPEDSDLRRTLTRLRLPTRGKRLHAWSTMYMRLITDPATLEIYRRDLRQQFYVSLDNALHDALLGAETSVIEAGPLQSPAD